MFHSQSITTSCQKTPITAVKLCTSRGVWLSYLPKQLTDASADDDCVCLPPIRTRYSMISPDKLSSQLLSCSLIVSSSCFLLNHELVRSANQTAFFLNMMAENKSLVIKSGLDGDKNLTLLSLDCSLALAIADILNLYGAENFSPTQESFQAFLTNPAETKTLRIPLTPGESAMREYLAVCFILVHIIILIIHFKHHNMHFHFSFVPIIIYCKKAN